VCVSVSDRRTFKDIVIECNKINIKKCVLDVCSETRTCPAPEKQWFVSRRKKNMGFIYCSSQSEVKRVQWRVNWVTGLMSSCNNGSIMTICQHDKTMTRSAHVKQKVTAVIEAKV